MEGRAQKTQTVLLLLCGLFLVTSALFAYLYYTNIPKRSSNNYQLLDPIVASLSTDLFQDQQKMSLAPGRDLHREFEQALNDTNATFSVYFEDLNSGGWVGVNEKMQYQPRSLFKVPVMMAVLKKIEDGTLSFDQVVLVQQEDLQTESTLFTQDDVGKYFTIRQLLEKMIRLSDNTALQVLHHEISDQDLLYAHPETGVALALNPNTNFTLSPKEYASIIRSLYKSQYLGRDYSEYGLELLASTIYTSGIPAGVPAGVTVSHKIGADNVSELYHDCGIVYYPRKPYILCIMSVNATRDEADATTAALSQIAYQYQEQATT